MSEEYAGQAIGLPASGPGSLAGLNRRVVAIVIDWAISTLIAVYAFGMPFAGGGGARGLISLGVFAALNIVLVSATGYTPGYRLMKIRLGSLGGALKPGQVLIRTALLCLVVPAVVWGTDGRGLHDRAARTVLVNA